MRTNFLCFLLISAVLGASSCKRTMVSLPPSDEAAASKESMLSAQEIAVRQEAESIEAFLKRSAWEMQQSGNGLYYHIEPSKNPKAPRVENGDAVRLSYRLRLLNGELIASSEESGLKTFIVGKSEVENGLTEAVLMMRKGDEAKLILPFRLGFGFSGNGKEVPPMATLLYEIRVEEVKIPNL